MREEISGVYGRSKPGREMIFGQKQRHEVVNEAYAVCGFRVSGRRSAEAALDVIESAEPGHSAVRGMDCVLVDGFGLAVQNRTFAK